MEYADIARSDGPRGEVLLRERRDEAGPPVIELRVNGVFVMDTAETSSERALATRALGLADEPRTVLIGGLGLGFTTREVLADPRIEHVEVAELEESLIGWMRDGLVPQGRQLLADERLSVRATDVAGAVAESADAAYDLVLLDVDNGPANLVHQENRALYEVPFLSDISRVLAPGGTLVVWSANEAPELEAAMTSVFGSCERITQPVQLQQRTEDYLLYLSRAPVTSDP